MRCKTCHTDKPVEEFSDNGRGRPRLTCRACYSVIRKATYQRDKARVRARSPSELEAWVAAQKAMKRKAAALRRVRDGGKLRGDGPCWCCRLPAVGATEFRLCVLCEGGR